MPRRPNLSTSARTATSAKACTVREYWRIRSFMSQPDSQRTMAAKAAGRISPVPSPAQPTAYTARWRRWGLRARRGGGGLQHGGGNYLRACRGGCGLEHDEGGGQQARCGGEIDEIRRCPRPAQNPAGAGPEIHPRVLPRAGFPLLRGCGRGWVFAKPAPAPAGAIPTVEHGVLQR